MLFYGRFWLIDMRSWQSRSYLSSNNFYAKVKKVQNLLSTIESTYMQIDVFSFCFLPRLTNKYFVLNNVFLWHFIHRVNEFIMILLRARHFTGIFQLLPLAFWMNSTYCCDKSFTTWYQSIAINRLEVLRFEDFPNMFKALKIWGFSHMTFLTKWGADLSFRQTDRVQQRLLSSLQVKFGRRHLSS